MEINLSEPFRWEDRAKLPQVAGVYVISKDSEGDVIYIGLTGGKGGLRNRIRAFNRATQDGVSAHAGGRTYHRIFGDDVTDLSVRVHDVEDFPYDASLAGPYIAYVERRLIWEHVERTGALPRCNSL